MADLEGSQEKRIHDHSGGSAHCVECGGRCLQVGFDRGATEFVRLSLEALGSIGYGELPNRYKDALNLMGIDDPNEFYRRHKIWR